MNRWRSRHLAGLAVFALLTAAGAVAVAGAGDTRWVVVRDAAGSELARAALSPSNGFSLRYRNSVYKSIAEEQFRVVEDDHLELVGLAADELAVLEEYYAAMDAVRGDPRSSLAWSVEVERPPIALPLRVRATALGERTLVTPDREVSLWRLAGDRGDTLVLLTIEGP